VGKKKDYRIGRKTTRRGGKAEVIAEV